MAGDTLSVSDVASLTGASMATVRRYSAALADSLSSDASPQPGQPRTYTRRDVRLLAWAVWQRQSGASMADIAERASRIADDELPDFDELKARSEVVIELEGLPVAKDSAGDSLALIARSLNALSAATANATDIQDIRQAISELSARVDELERRIETLPGWLRRRW